MGITVLDVMKGSEETQFCIIMSLFTLLYWDRHDHKGKICLGLTKILINISCFTEGKKKKKKSGNFLWPWLKKIKSTLNSQQCPYKHRYFRLRYSDADVCKFSVDTKFISKGRKQWPCQDTP